MKLSFVKAAARIGRQTLGRGCREKAWKENEIFADRLGKRSKGCGDSS
jgi:hypothetical protein